MRSIESSPALDSALDSAVGIANRDDDLMTAARTIRRGATALASRARAERRGELTINQTAVLGLLSRTGAMTPSEIADKLHTSLQSLTRTFAALETGRMLSRAIDPDDRRQSILSITAAGSRALRTEMRPRDEWVARAIDREFTVAERDLLVIASTLLERLSEVDASSVPREP